MGDTTLLEAVVAAESGEVLEGAPFYIVQEAAFDEDVNGRRFGGLARYFAEHADAPRRERLRRGTCGNALLPEDDPNHCDVADPDGTPLLGGTVYAIETRIPGAMRVDGLCMAKVLNEDGTITLEPGCGFEVHRAGWTSAEARNAFRESLGRTKKGTEVVNIEGAATGVMFGKLGANAFGGEAEGDALTIDYLTDTIKHALLTSTASIDVDADEVFGDLANEVANGNGYTTGGVTAASKTVTYNATGNKTVLDCADPSWTASGAGFTARDMPSYRDGTTDPLITHLDFGADQVLAASDVLTINIDATNGLFFVTAT